MAIKNYYVVLGVHREESATGIRTAYKDLAKRFHPDRIGEDGTKAFQEISEAYQTLSDPEKRRSHNLLLDHEEERRGEASLRINVRRDWEPEPLSWRKVSTVESDLPAWPSVEDLYRRGRRNSGGAAGPRAERAEGLNFEVLLSADEARRGGVISVEVPTWCPCFVCGGRGRSWMFTCFDCQGLGRIDNERTINIRFPPWVRNGTVIEVALTELGTENLYVRLYLVVS